MYHDCLAVILTELEGLQADPPIVELNLGGMKKRVKLILQVSFVMGDQKSQDTLCGRKKSNGGGAARVHRGCMCSSLHGSDSSMKCQPVSKPILDRLRDVSFEDEVDSVSMKAVDTKLPTNVRGNVEKKKQALAMTRPDHSHIVVCDQRDRHGNIKTGTWFADGGLEAKIVAFEAMKTVLQITKQIEFNRSTEEVSFINLTFHVNSWSERSDLVDSSDSTFLWIESIC